MAPCLASPSIKDGKTRFAVDNGKVLVSSQNSEVMLAAGQATAAEPGDPALLTGYQFELKGTISSMEGDMWTVSGVAFKVTSETSIEGEPALGSFVEVQGLVSGEEWIADKVEVSAPKEEKNEFTGILEDMDGDTWVVSGAELKVTQRHEISTLTS